MSISSEITRLQNAKADLKTAIEGKGVTVSSSAKLEDYADLVDSISTGITPSGTLSVTANGTYDVTNYASADVNVQSGYTITQIIERSGITGDVVYNGNKTTLPYGALADTNITSFSSSVITDAWGYCFYNCESLRSVSLPNFSANSTVSATSMFYNCTALEEIYIPKFKRSGGNIFQNCSSLRMLVLPMANYTLQGYFCSGCTSLKTVDIGVDIGGTLAMGNAFSNSGLETLILRRTAGVVALTNTNNFNNSPFASNGTGGTLYVPSALISSYQSASNWSTILGYTNNQIKSIESTHTDPTAPIDLTLYYADGTLIGA